MQRAFCSGAGAPAQPFRLRRKGFAKSKTRIGYERSPTNPRLAEQQTGFQPSAIRELFTQTPQLSRPIEEQLPPRKFKRSPKKLQMVFQLAPTELQTFFKEIFKRPA